MGWDDTMKWTSIARFGLAISMGLALASCSMDKPIQPPKGKTAEELYKQGTSQLEQKNYKQALENFYKLKYDFPSEAAAVMADLKIADAHYANKEYTEAIEAYEEVRKTHPASPYIPYVIYMLGMCHYNKSLSVDRDQTETEKALTEFQYLLTHFSHTPYAYDAHEKAQECLKKLSDHEVYVGDFYYKMGKYGAAIQRYEAAIAKYPTVPLAEEVLFRLAEAYQETKQPEKAAKTLKVLLQQYPKGKYASKAQKLLEGELAHVASSGDLPREATPSPPSRAQEEPKRQMEASAPIFLGEKEAPSEPAKIRPEAPRAEEPRKEVELQTGPIAQVSSSAPQWPQGPNMVREEKREEFERSEDALKDKGDPSQIQDSGRKPEPDRASIPEPSKGSEPVKMEVGLAPAAPEESPSVGGEKKTKDTSSGSAKGEAVGFGELRSDKPINITADRMDAFQKENRVIFEGNVVVQQEETFLYAKKIIADMAPQKEGGGIKKVVALENVRITQNDRVATCDRAEFDNVTRTIELHGNPKIWQGKDWIDGQKVTVQLDQEKMTVVGTPDKRVSAVLHPKPQRKEDESGQKAEASSAERRKMIASFAPTEAESKASKGQAKADKPKGKTHEDKGPEPQGHEKGEPPSTPSPETPRPQALAISTKAVAAEEEAARIAAKAPRGQESSSSQVKGGEAKKETKAQEPEPLERFLEKWRRAWESKDIESYMSFYSKKFKSGSMDWNGWRNYKANTFKKTGTIKVVIESVQSRKVGEKVQVSFVQRYSADKHSDYGIKELVIVKEEGQWRIVAEGWRPIKEKSS